MIYYIVASKITIALVFVPCCKHHNKTGTLIPSQFTPLVYGKLQPKRRLQFSL